MSAADYMRHPKYKQYFSETQICERLFSITSQKTRLLKLNHTEIIFIVNDDAVGFKFAGFAGGFP